MCKILRKIYDRQPLAVKTNIRRLYFFVIKKYKNFINLIIRKHKKIKRFFIKENFDRSYSFVILCVKNKAYVKLTIKNINSLHYLNPTHKFTIHCDEICYKQLLKKRYLFDYFRNVEIVNQYGTENKPWQLFKIETLIAASKNNQILIDADSLWHNDPEINFNKITFQVSACKIKERQGESSVMTKLFHSPGWVEFDHYVTGFLSIPSKFMTEKLANDCRCFTNKILDDSLDFLENSQKENIKRISEELAVNIAIQSNYNKNLITTLKIKDSKGDKNIFQSLYYGCANNIIE